MDKIETTQGRVALVGDEGISGKICSKCGENKKLTEFYKNKNSCKLCHKLYCEKNKEKVSASNKEYYQKNKEKIQTQYYQKNKEKVSASNKEYYQKNKPRIIERNMDYRRDRMKYDVNFKLSVRLRNRLFKALRNNRKVGSAVSDLGCSVEFLRSHLESQFEPGMTWENWSLLGWHIDHIIPLASFDLTDREQLLKACHYTNLRPLWGEENLKKGKKLIKN